ncbi:hypothetical protein BZG36_01153 [Bifiguratus adelaidae]|uniref:PPPDE domain-containing protein n=1 Tax=Bifiguratus adelaidae TaxID=1938954 RepID=A0A261Y5V3_9FUNG|nr:hypothetical protein BZG36_01153 [Bifiguratus adelaidae]
MNVWNPVSVFSSLLQPIPDGHEVRLNVYDMIPPNWVTNAGYWMGLGIYHSGLEVCDKEFCFGGHEQDFTGVFAVEPKEGPPGVIFRQAHGEL